MEAEDNFDDTEEGVGSEPTEMETASPELENDEIEGSSPTEEVVETKSNIQKRFDKLTKDKYDLINKNEYLQGQLDALQQGGSEETPSEPANNVSTDRPSSEDYETIDDYVFAVSEWNNKQIANKQESNRVIQAFERKVEEFKKIHPDFNEVARNSHMQAFYKSQPEIAQTLERAENGVELAYYFGNNPGVARDIAAMSKEMAFMEIGRISSKLTATASNPVSQAPAPMKPVGKTAPVDTGQDYDNMTMAEYANARRA